MIPTPLRDRYKLRLNIRPRKLAYLLPEDDPATLRRIVRLCCSQWGGLYNLIVPIRPDGQMYALYEWLFKKHEPDLFVHYLPSSPEAEQHPVQKLKSRLAELFPHRSIYVEDGPNFDRSDRSAHALGIWPSDLIEAAVLNILLNVGASADDTAFSVLFGEIPEGQEADFERTIRFGPRKLDARIAGFWDAQFDDSDLGSPLNFTSYGLRCHRASGFPIDGNHFDIVLADSPQALSMFWNYRAHRECVRIMAPPGRRTFLLPNSILNNSEALEQMFSFIRRNLDSPHHSTAVPLRFHTWTAEGKEQLETRLSQFCSIAPAPDKDGVVETQSHMSWGDRVPERYPEDEPLRYAFLDQAELQTSHWTGYGHQTTEAVQLREKENEVLLTPPDGFCNRSGGLTAVDIECAVWERFPRSAGIAEKVLKGACFSRYGITTCVPVREHPSHFEFYVPTDWEGLELYFNEKGYHIRQSDSAPYISAFAALFGGMKAAKIVRSRSAWKLLESLAIKSSKKVAQRIIKRLGPKLGDIEDLSKALRELEVAHELKRVPKSYKQLRDGPLSSAKKQLLPLLSTFVQAHVVHRGFHLRCSKCGTTNWYPLVMVAETVRCVGCLIEFPLPVEHPPGSEIEWDYTLNALVNRAMDQDGLPVLAALSFLAEKYEMAGVVPGLELLDGAIPRAELDFVFVSKQKLVAGECKAGSELSPKDFQTARLARELGVSAFYFCTASEFSEKSKADLDEFVSENEGDEDGMKTEVLEADQLFPDAK